MRGTILKGSLFAAALVSLTVFGASAQDQHKRPEAALGEAFCLMKDNPGAAGPLLLVTTALAAEIRAAMAKNAEIQKAHPDEKPPLGDGVPFQSYQDVSPRCEVGTVEGEGIGAVVEIRHGFPDEPSANYSDRLVLGAGWNDGTLGIDDVLYGADGDNGTLRKTLVAAFE